MYQISVLKMIPTTTSFHFTALIMSVFVYQHVLPSFINVSNCICPVYGHIYVYAAYVCARVNGPLQVQTGDTRLRSSILP